MLSCWLDAADDADADAVEEHVVEPFLWPPYPFWDDDIQSSVKLYNNSMQTTMKRSSINHGADATRKLDKNTLLEKRSAVVGQSLLYLSRIVITLIIYNHKHIYF